MSLNRPHDVRAVNRKVFLEALAAELPEETIRFNSRVSGLKVSESRLGFTQVELQDGSIYSAKVCALSPPMHAAKRSNISPMHAYLDGAENDESFEE